MIAALIPILGEIGKRVANSLFPDPADELKRVQVEQEMAKAVLENAATMEKAAAEIIKTEGASSHWLAANWRPITMLVFVGLVVSRWLGYGAPGMSEAEYLSVYELIKLGLTGYVVGRSAERIIPGVVSALKK